MKSFLYRVDIRVGLIYAVFGVLWILLSDRLLESLVTDTAVLTDIQTYKGGIFVLLSSLIIFSLLRRELKLRTISEEKVLESEERHRQLFENSLDAILLTAPDGRIHSANLAACQMFGKTEAQIQQTGRDGLVDVSDPRLKSALEERTRTGKFHGELTFIREDVLKFEGELSTTLFKNSKGVDLTSMIIRDVSERKRAEEELRGKNHELTQAYDAVIEGWSRAMDLRDKETENHTLRVTKLTLNLARLLRLPEGDLIHIKRGALLHDIGKLGIPDNILLKPEKLTDEETQIIRRHPVLAYEMLVSLEFLKPALDIPYCHHEKWDGTGYPRQLRGEEIPFAARIFAIADVWDALTSDRAYRAAWTKNQTLEFIRQESGKHFDPEIARVFLAAADSLIA